MYRYIKMNPMICLKVLLMLNLISLNKTSALPASSTESNSANSTQISWIQRMRDLRNLFHECENSPSIENFTTWQCFKMTSLTIVEQVLRNRIISLGPGIRFVQRTDINENWQPAKIYQNDYWQRKDFQHLTWFDRLALSFTNMLNSHMLEVNLKQLTEAYMESINKKDPFLSNNTDPVGTARHRRHRFNMMLTMMFGVTAFGAVLVPMGFQMLSIVSGKALLLAKMALLLASINGLKRVANTGVHYGLYHVPGEHYGHYYDRGDVHHPRNVQNLTPVGNSIGVDLTV